VADSTQLQNSSEFNQIEYRRAWQKKNRAKCAEYSAKWRRDNPEKARQAEKKWRDKNSDPRRHKRLQTRYGVTLEQYEVVLKRQSGVCAICNETSRDGRRLAVDHCHYTGKIRGLLCFHCNTAVGKLGDTADKVARAVKYLADGGL
jgi:hypothetical protein